MGARVLNLLVVDDNRSAADTLALLLRRSGDRVEVVYDGQAAIERLSEGGLDLVLTDLKMEPIDGISVLRAARQLRPPPEVIVFTAFGAVDVAVKAIRLGARDFLTKPVSVDQISQRVEQIRSDLNGQAPTGTPASPDRRLTPAHRRPTPLGPFIAYSRLGRDLLASLERVAGVPSRVWLEGEPGAGRGYAARHLHLLSGGQGDLVVRDPHREAAWPDSGTVMLTNVDDLPDDIQRRLHQSLGEAPEGLRIVSTARADSRRLVSEGRLRQDLYHDLAVITIQVPPLRSRREDVLPMLEQALSDFAHRFARPRPMVDADRAARLQRYEWPGNIRELRNLAERAVVLGADALDVAWMDEQDQEMPKLGPGFDLAEYMESVERRLIVEALKQANGDRNQAGRLLGVERNTLRYKLNKYGLLDR